VESVSGHIQSFHLEGDASYDLTPLPHRGQDGFVDFRLLICSERFRWLDVAFDYRCHEGESWRTDASLTAGDFQLLQGNRMFGLSASPAGIAHRFRWAFTANDLTIGSPCEYRLRVLPSVRLFSRAGSWSALESVAGSSRRQLEAIRARHLIGIGLGGEELTVDDASFTVLSAGGQVQFILGGLDTPNCAQQKRNGDFLVLDAGHNRLMETDAVGATVRTLDLSPWFTAPAWFVFEETTANLLVCGNVSGKVCEVTWDTVDAGELLWDSSTVPISLSSPMGVGYDADDVSRVLVADTGNDRLVLANRNTGAVTYLAGADFGSATVAFHRPFLPLSFPGGLLASVEQRGETEAFSADAGTHAALVRARSDSTTDPAEKNELPAYRNLLFAPIRRSPASISVSP
jgi:hypothetical protein